MMTLELRPMPDAIGVEILGIDPTNLADADRVELRQAFLRHSVLILRRTGLTPETQLAMASAMGEPEIHPIAAGRLEDHPAILVPKPYGVQHADDPDEIIGRIPWHADLTYTTHQPRGALLRAVAIPPEGGQTGFIDTAAVYEALPDSQQKSIDSLDAIHRLSRAQQLLGLDMSSERTRQIARQFPAVAQPLVLRDPETGCRCLNISPLFADEIMGMGRSEGAALLKDLENFATQERFVYWHEWQEDDLVIWNNYRTLHCAAGHKQKHTRTMHRATLKGDTTFGRVLGPDD